MSLIGLSSDCIGRIAFYTDAVSVLRLLECGHALLCAKIKQTRLDLEQQTWPFMKFPFSLFDQLQLSALSLSAVNYGSYFPLTLGGALPMPKTLTKSLSKLKISCIQSFSLLALENGMPVLDTVLPNLKSLHLSDSSVLLTEHHFKAIPNGLHHLRLLSRYIPSSTPPLPCSVLQNLPPQLEELEVDTSRILPDPERRDYSTILWPLSLRILRLQRMEACFLQHLPGNLDTLMIGSLVTDESIFKGPIILPPSLKELSIMGNLSRCGLKITPRELPRTLETCWTDLDFEGFNTSDLPKSITDIDCLPTIQKYGNIADILPNIQRIDTIFTQSSIPLNELSNLPSKLVELSSMEISIADIPKFPPTIRNLGLKIRPSSVTSQIGSTSEWLPSSDIPPCDMSRLPRDLRTLVMFNGDSEARFCRSDFDFLPPHLTDISFSLHDIEDGDTLLGLPSTLTQLAIDISATCSKKLVSDSQLVDKLPSSLKDITINTEAEGVVWTDWMFRLHRFPALNAVQIYLHSVNESSDQIDLAFLPSLPDSILGLVVPMNRTTLVPEQMQRLPKKLVDLQLSADVIGSTATDECFAHLPRSIASLQLPDELEGLTANFFNFIPSTLISISVPTSLEEEKRAYFNRQPEWGGYQPF